MRSKKETDELIERLKENDKMIDEAISKEDWTQVDILINRIKYL